MRIVVGQGDEKRPAQFSLERAPSIADPQGGKFICMASTDPLESARSSEQEFR